ncbi:hypothetical protein V6N12_060876 [Hibiscus sabdariffa]|uniref:Uncharacterized protein n=1 Tax=Hibiscus sabdariffa TaxID=183260 RepID=A0ABR1ZGQ5_9ROSI
MTTTAVFFHGGPYAGRPTSTVEGPSSVNQSHKGKLQKLAICRKENAWNYNNQSLVRKPLHRVSSSSSS